MSDRVRGALPPAPRSRGHILRVLTAETLQFVCISRTVFGQLTHWNGHRTSECKADKARCDGCQAGLPGKWKGYLHVQTDIHGGDVWLEITPTCWHTIVSQLKEGETMRGMIFRVRRTKGGAKGRYICEVLQRRVDDATLPQEKDPLALLHYLWSSKRPAGQIE